MVAWWASGHVADRVGSSICPELRYNSNLLARDDSPGKPRGSMSSGGVCQSGPRSVLRSATPAIDTAGPLEDSWSKSAWIARRPALRSLDYDLAWFRMRHSRPVAIGALGRRRQRLPGVSECQGEVRTSLGPPKVELTAAPVPLMTDSMPPEPFRKTVSRSCNTTPEVS